MGRIEARDTVFKFVFEDLFHAPNDSLSYEEFLQDNQMDSENLKFVRDNYTGIIEHWDELKNIITTHLKDYTIDRIYKVDLAILMCAVYEIKYTSADVKLIINEACNLCKKYSTEKSYAFINGVLANIIKE